MPLLFATFPLFVLLGIAVVTDLRARRIPNWLNALIIVTGLTNALAFGTPATLSQSLLGFLVGFGILLIPFALGAIGGGDVKMLAGIGAWLGPIATLQVYAVAGIAGLIIVLVQCAANGRLTRLVSNSTLIVANFANVGRLGKDHVVASGQSLRSIDKPLPYAVPAIIGVAVTVLMNVI
jgi:prepilin peptidase CpaA